MPPIPLKDASDEVRFTPALDAVVMRALSRAPAERFPSVIAFSEAFENAAVLAEDSPRMLAKFKGLLKRSR
jgi:serine/threonine-protein kinase